MLAVVLATGMAVLALTEAADGRAHRPAHVPHGNLHRCATCHVDDSGGGPRNPFGQTIEAGFLSEPGYEGDAVWGPELAGLDADGDGFTNGEELQDPEGRWSRGDDPPGDRELVTHPGDPESHPPIATAVDAVTWSGVKLFVFGMALR